MIEIHAAISMENWPEKPSLRAISSTPLCSNIVQYEVYVKVKKKDFTSVCCYLGLALPFSWIELPMRISAPSMLLWFPSARMVTFTVLILYGVKRSSLHHGLSSFIVVLQDPWFTLLSWLPSIALSGLAVPSWEDCVAFPPSAMFSPGQKVVQISRRTWSWVQYRIVD